ncbi:UNVERIFIED_CONTAM: hypothetical protein FKN15_009766 [Acipenser sinensis]
MFRERKHLQELPSSSGNFPKWTQLQETKKTHKVPLEDNCENECTPQDLIQSWSPPQKRPRICKGKENEDIPFVLARRPRKKRESEAVISWDSLPDELLLRIFHGLPLVDLLKVSQVCKRWHRLACLAQNPELLRLNMSGCSGFSAHSLGEMLHHCTRLDELNMSWCEFTSDHVKAVVNNIPESVTQLNLSGYRQNLHIAGVNFLPIQEKRCLAQNPELLRLNMSGCSGFSAHSLGEMLHHCTRLDELNLSWCEFTSDHVKAVVNNIPESVTQLNLSGYRQNLHIADVEVLVARCPHITNLDLSDSVLLTSDSFQHFRKLSALRQLALSRCYQIHPAALVDSVLLTSDSFQHFCKLPALCQLALSRCYQIHPAALVDFENFPSLKMLEVFGILPDTNLPILTKGLPHIKINSCYFTTIARPTVGSRKNRDIWGISCRLTYRAPFTA